MSDHKLKIAVKDHCYRDAILFHWEGTWNDFVDKFVELDPETIDEMIHPSVKSERIDVKDFLESDASILCMEGWWILVDDSKCFEKYEVL